MMTPQQRARCSIAADMPELFFSDDFRGYSWAFRKGDYLNVGAGREDDRNLAGHARRVLTFLKQRDKIPPDIPDAFKGHSYLLHPHPARRLIEDGVLLIGDAAGLAFAASGEGIRPAVESGLLAADVVLRADGDYREARLRPYEELVGLRFGAGSWSAVAADAIPASIRHFAARKLFENPWFVRHVVLDRWFLRARQLPLSSLINAPPRSGPERNI